MKYKEFDIVMTEAGFEENENFNTSCKCTIDLSEVEYYRRNNENQDEVFVGLRSGESFCIKLPYKDFCQEMAERIMLANLN